MSSADDLEQRAELLRRATARLMHENASIPAGRVIAMVAASQEQLDAGNELLGLDLSAPDEYVAPIIEHATQGLAKILGEPSHEVAEHTSRQRREPPRGDAQAHV